jgi:hypothetical protein
MSPVCVVDGAYALRKSEMNECVTSPVSSSDDVMKQRERGKSG